MKEHYQINEKEEYIGLLNKEDMTNQPLCPECRDPVTDIKRYGRIIKKSWIDQLEKKYTLKLVDLLTKAEDKLQHRDSIPDLDKSLDYLYQIIQTPQPLLDIYEATIAKISKNNEDLLLEILLSSFSAPKPSFERIIEAKRMILKCDYFKWVIEVSDKDYNFVNDFKELNDKVDEISQICKTNKCEKQNILSQYEFFWIIYNKIKSLKLHGMITEKNIKDGCIALLDFSVQVINDNILSNSKSVECNIIDPAKDLSTNIVKLKKIIIEGIEKEELKEVFLAMKSEFSGTGHWYRCPNGHYYTIGECGMAMQESTCIECGAKVGGSNHQTLPQNTHAEDLERENI